MYLINGLYIPDTIQGTKYSLKTNKQNLLMAYIVKRETSADYK